MGNAQLVIRTVLAGAYRANDRRNSLTHACFAHGHEPGTPVCSRVKSESVADGYAYDGVGQVPTCKACLRFWHQYQAANRMFPGARRG